MTPELAYDLKILNISIHVPTRGTTAISSVTESWDNFNPRAHEGHDDHIGYMILKN